MALDLDSKLSPSWVKDSRGYFIMEKGDEARIGKWIDQNDWQAVYDYWLPYASSAKKTVKSKAQYNLALASEMLGKIDEAIEWANQSYYTQYHSQAERYLYKLGTRKSALKQFQKLEEK